MKLILKLRNQEKTIKTEKKITTIQSKLPGEQQMKQEKFRKILQKKQKNRQKYRLLNPVLE